MRKTVLALLLALAPMASAWGKPQGPANEAPACGVDGVLPGGVEARLMPSQTFGRDFCYLVVTPPAGVAGEPGLLVLLHGLGAGPGEWIAHGRIHELLADAMRAGRLPRTFAIIPEGEKGYWADWADGEHPYGQLVREYIDHARSALGIEAGPGRTAVVGVALQSQRSGSLHAG